MLLYWSASARRFITLLLGAAGGYLAARATMRSELDQLRREMESRGGRSVSAPAPAAPASQAVRIVNVIDPGMAGDYLNSAAGEKTILNVLSRNGAAVRELLR